MSSPARYITVHGQPFFVLGGQVNNSSAYTREQMAPLWDALVHLGANTAEVPVYWEQLEPEEGAFDVAMVDSLLADARAHGLKLILLWFATWKNGTMKYAPGWVKQQPARFQRVITPEGLPLPVLSPHCAANLAADQTAFHVLMKHLRAQDQDARTVIAVQVENEPGSQGAARDYAGEATALFEQPVPVDLARMLPRATRPALRTLWEENGARVEGTWATVFGRRAAEMFSAWHVARYVDAVAAAGKRVYDLPMYVNVWMGESGFRRAGYDYPAGGAVSDVLDIWKAAAPHLDLLAPDIYARDTASFRTACAAYNRDDNPLFIPESWIAPWLARHMFYAIGEQQAIGLAVFGIDDYCDRAGTLLPSASAVAESIGAVRALLPLLPAYQGTGRLHAIVQEEGAETQYIALDGYAALVRFGTFWHAEPRPVAPDAQGRGLGLLVQTDDKEFYVTGVGFSVFIRPLENVHGFLTKTPWDGRFDPWLSVEAGHFEGERWVVEARLSGDESDFGLTPQGAGWAIRAVFDSTVGRTGQALASGAGEEKI